MANIKTLNNANLVDVAFADELSETAGDAVERTPRTKRGFAAGKASADRRPAEPGRAPGRRILAQDRYVSNDTWSTRLNNNDLIIGSTGAGKTRYYVKPNLLQMNESVIVTDTKGSLVEEVGPVLEAHGYDVLSIDFTNLSAGIGYNPLDFVHVDPATGRPQERDVMSIASILCPMESLKDPFWDYAAKTYIAMLVGYVLEFLPEKEQNLASVVELAGGLQPEGDKLPTGTTGKLLDRVADEYPRSFAVRKWRSIRGTSTAEKMYASILGIMAEKLDTLTFDDTMKMFAKSERIDFAALGQRKTALFLTVSDTDRSMDRMATLLYAQALQELCDYADNECSGHALPVPVRLYLDDFATNCAIPDFDNIISVVRSRNIAVSVVLQSITQLDAIYGEARATTIINGCDHLLYLGGQDIDTASFIGKRVGKTLDTIMQQGLDTIWLLERGKRGEMVKLFDLKSHELYGSLPEADRKRGSTPALAG